MQVKTLNYHIEYTNARKRYKTVLKSKYSKKHYTTWACTVTLFIHLYIHLLTLHHIQFNNQSPLKRKMSMLTIYCILLLVLSSTSAREGSGDLKVEGDNKKNSTSFNVVDFGANGDGHVDDTKVIIIGSI